MRKREYILGLTIEQLEDGRYLGRCPRLPGLNVEGDSIEDVLKLAPKVARALIAAMEEKGVALPRGLTRAKAPLRVQVLVAV
jgi:predicted RNase H-like HicB family nuclease